MKRIRHFHIIVLLTAMAVVVSTGCRKSEGGAAVRAEDIWEEDEENEDIPENASIEEKDAYNEGEAENMPEDIIVSEEKTGIQGENKNGENSRGEMKAGGSSLETAEMPAAPVFTSEEISDEIFARIYGKSYKEDCTVPREELRYLQISCIGFDGEPYVGELIANEAIAGDLLEIFQELYEAGYPIERMRLIDEYEADDEASMADNNTSCFNFRRVSGTERLSNHSYGKAIDVNPLYNPYVRTSNGALVCEPAAGEAYMDREQDFPYKIDEEDLCCRLFKEHGFTWGGNWNSVKDYQHFQKE